MPHAIPVLRQSVGQTTKSTKRSKMAGDKPEVSEIGFVEGPSSKPSFGRRVLNHYKRWWWVHIIAIIVVVLVVTLPLYVLLCVINPKKKKKKDTELTRQ